MTNTAGDKRRKRLAIVVALLCALLASLAVAAAPAAAESGDAAPVRNLDEGGMVFGIITGPEAPEEYPFHVDLGEEQELRQVSTTEVAVVESGHFVLPLNAEPASDAEGATVPTTLEETGDEQVTLTVHYRDGNPAAGGAPFVYPIVSGAGWPGGFHTVTVEMNNPFGNANESARETSPPAPTEPVPVPTCKVPALRGYSLRGAKNRLRAAHCGIGAARLADGATAGKGKVVKQFHPAGLELAAGAPVAVKLAGH